MHYTLNTSRDRLHRKREESVCCLAPSLCMSCSLRVSWSALAICTSSFLIIASRAAGEAVAQESITSCRRIHINYKRLRDQHRSMCGARPRKNARRGISVETSRLEAYVSMRHHERQAHEAQQRYVCKRSVGLAGAHCT